MDYLRTAFKAVSLIFAFAAVSTGTKAVVAPTKFATDFGLPLGRTGVPSEPPGQPDITGTSASTGARQAFEHPGVSYVSLMGIRQLATGLIIVAFAYQSKWMEIAVILAIIGTLVAGTDGLYLARSGSPGLGRYHAIPGAAIAALSAWVAFAGV